MTMMESKTNWKGERQQGERAATRNGIWRRTSRPPFPINRLRCERARHCILHNALYMKYEPPSCLSLALSLSLRLSPFPDRVLRTTVQSHWRIVAGFYWPLASSFDKFDIVDIASCIQYTLVVVVVVVPGNRVSVLRIAACLQFEYTLDIRLPFNHVIHTLRDS